MTVARRVARGASALLAGELVRMAAKGLVILLLTRVYLEPDEYGLLFFATAVLGVAALFATLGFGKSAGRYIAEYRETDPGQIPHIVSSALGYNLVSVLAVAAVLVAFRDQLAALLGEPALSPLLLVGAAYVGGLSLQKTVSLLFQGFNRVDLGALVNVVSSVGLLGFVVGLLALGFGVVGALLGYAAGYLLAAAVGLGILYAKFYRRYRRGEPAEDGLSRRLLEYSVPLAMTRGAHVLDTRIDAVLVGFLVNPLAVAYYTLGKQITEFVIAPATALGVAVSPTYGEQKAADDLRRAAEVYETTFEYTLSLYLPAAAGLFVVAGPAVRLVFGEGYLGAVPVVQVFSVFVLLSALIKITDDGLDYLGRARARAVAKGGASVGNFALNLLLIPAFGAVGAAVATVVTTAALVGVELVIVFRELRPSRSRLLRSAATVGVVTTGTMGAVLPFVGFISGLLSLAAVVGVGVAAWAVLATTVGVVDVGHLRAMLS